MFHGCRQGSGFDAIYNRVTLSTRRHVRHWLLLHWSDLHAHSRAGWCILWLHLGVGWVVWSLIHELVVKLQRLHNFHVQFWQLRVIPAAQRQMNNHLNVLSNLINNRKSLWHLTCQSPGASHRSVGSSVHMHLFTYRQMERKREMGLEIKSAAQADCSCHRQHDSVYSSIKVYTLQLDQL